MAVSDELIREKQAQVLEETARDLSWFGAQGNTVEPDTAWAGVTACMTALRRKAASLREGDPVTVDPPADQRCGKPLMDGRNEIRCWLKAHHEEACR